MNLKEDKLLITYIAFVIFVMSLVISVFAASMELGNCLDRFGDFQCLADYNNSWHQHYLNAVFR